MKKLISSLSLLGFLLSLTAQNDLQIVDPAKKWTYMDYIWMPPDINIKWSYYVKFYGDTIINQIPYIKIWESNSDPPEDWYLRGYAREDTFHSVYFRNNNGVEGLAYKFNVNVGDTFSMFNPFHYTEFVVEVINIDSVYIEPANEFRKRMTVTEYDATWQNEEIWIEGIGSLAGITSSAFHIIPMTGSNMTALCMWKNENIIFSNPNWDDCFEIVSTKETVQNEPELIIYPSPLNDRSRIIVDGFKGSVLFLEIKDILGRSVKNFTLNTTREIMLERDKFNCGLYLVLLKDGNKIVATKKLFIK